MIGGDISKYKNISKVLKSYGQTIVSDLVRVVGVDTGALRKSLSYTVENKNTEEASLILKMLDYGKYINPWVKNTGSRTKPGYITILKRYEYKIIDDLEKAYTKDITVQLMKSFSKFNNSKVVSVRKIK